MACIHFYSNLSRFFLPVMPCYTILLPINNPNCTPSALWNWWCPVAKKWSRKLAGPNLARTSSSERHCRFMYLGKLQSFTITNLSQGHFGWIPLSVIIMYPDGGLEQLVELLQGTPYETGQLSSFRVAFHLVTWWIHNYGYISFTYLYTFCFTPTAPPNCFLFKQSAPPRCILWKERHGPSGAFPVLRISGCLAYDCFPCLFYGSKDSETVFGIGCWGLNAFSEGIGSTRGHILELMLKEFQWEIRNSVSHDFSIKSKASLSQSLGAAAFCKACA